ncbi:MAG: hypothetical protein B6U69_01245 [Thermofilum sp. ex4484_15]|nr:MAG: hypothetical protein B6U69_01245 [Thermofilum sp. ex4484_15]
MSKKAILILAILSLYLPYPSWQEASGAYFPPSAYGPKRPSELREVTVRMPLSDLKLTTLRKPKLHYLKLMYVIAEAKLWKYLRKELLTYASDVEREGLGVYIFAYEGGDPESLRDFLRSSLPYGLKGVLLVGDIPSAFYEVRNPPASGFPSYERFPTDLFYMDLNGLWVDSDGNGIFDKHEGDREPEIWVGRLTPPVKGREAIIMLINYFRRDHEFRLGALRPRHRALIYVDDDWVSPPSAVDVSSEIREAIGPLYSSVEVIKDKVLTNPSDYLRRVNASWSLVHVFVHGWSEGHIFKVRGRWDGYLNYTALRKLKAGAYFYVLDSCSSAKFVQANYIGGYYLFRGNGLVVIGSTKAGGATYAPLSKGYSFTAYLDSDLNWSTGYGGADYLIEISKGKCTAYRWEGVKWGKLTEGDIWIGLNFLIAHLRVKVGRNFRLKLSYYLPLGEAYGGGTLTVYPGSSLRLEAKGYIREARLEVNLSALIVKVNLTRPVSPAYLASALSTGAGEFDAVVPLRASEPGVSLSTGGATVSLKGLSVSEALPLRVLKGLQRPYLNVKLRLYAKGSVPGRLGDPYWLYFGEGELKFTLKFKRGWNFFSLPLAPVYPVTLKRDLVKAVYRWDAKLRAWLPLFKDGVRLRVGEAYWLEALKGFNLTYLGYIPLVSYRNPLAPGEVRPVGVVGIGTLSPSSLCKALNATRIYEWEGRWVEYVLGVGGGIKYVKPGKGYLLERR